MHTYYSSSIVAVIVIIVDVFSYFPPLMTNIKKDEQIRPTLFSGFGTHPCKIYYIQHMFICTRVFHYICVCTVCPSVELLLEGGTVSNSNI